MTDKDKLIEMLITTDLNYYSYTGVSIDTIELTAYYQFDFDKKGKLLPCNINTDNG